MTTLKEVLDRLQACGCKVEKNGSGYKAQCPNHPDKHPSLSVRETPNGGIWIKCWGACKCRKEDVLAKINLKLSDLSPVRNGHHSNYQPWDAIHQYYDQEGLLRYEVLRRGTGKAKEIRQRRPDGMGGWIWSLKDVERLLYRLPELLGAEPDALVFIPEGEKAVDYLSRRGVLSTCNSEGATTPRDNKWRRSFAKWLKGHPCVILADHDEAGEVHAKNVCTRLVREGVRAVILRLPRLEQDGDDAVDWFERYGGSVEELAQLAVAALEPEAVPWEEPAPIRPPTLPAFPVETLPDWVREMVMAVAQKNQVPADLPALMALSILAMAYQRRVEVQIRPDWREQLSLYTVSIAEPGERKSPMARDLSQPVKEYEAELRADMKATIAASASERRILERQLARIEDLAAKAKTEMERHNAMQEARDLAKEIARQETLHEPHLLADDITTERLAVLLSQQGERIAFLAEESSVLEVMAGRYSGKPNFNLYLKGHDGGSVSIERQSRDSVTLERPAITFGLSVQPEVIRELAAERAFRGRGLLARFLYGFPEPALGARESRPGPISEVVRERWRTNVKKALATPVDETDGALRPWVLEFSEPADDEMVAFQDWIEPQLAPGAELSHLSGWASKLAGQVARIAGLLHLADLISIELPWSFSVEPSTVQKARRIADYLIPHARAAFQEMGADPVIHGAKTILTYLKRDRVAHFSVRDLQNRLQSHFAHVYLLEEPLRLLVAHGWIRRLPQEETRAPGGQPGPRYETHPSLREASQ